MFETIAEVETPAIARVLIAALKAHGFTLLEGGENGLPGMPGVVGLRGIPIRVRAEEAADAAILAEALLTEMRGQK
ncbi:hypothetical protein EMQ25_14430 [Arsenicitalea aurantiaca]|uniref:DUF2007 domain-containing protein n=1 Tax=Arsenicitalea aurantiaca TaxID=1783274 RepID=A0A433X5J0_9HYPH|nr:hypothetical protein [Arsenicitalea aurantiaca]RUT29317.1 hypothetical protein EMQ25_14430 [Arsenicitalea aurantiaca]